MQLWAVRNLQAWRIDTRRVLIAAGYLPKLSSALLGRSTVYVLDSESPFIDAFFRRLDSTRHRVSRTPGRGLRVQHIFDEIRAAVDANAWVLALFGLLAIPDICAALADPDGQTSGSRYKQWFGDNLGDKYSLPRAAETFSPGEAVDAAAFFAPTPQTVAEFAHELYKLRCTMLHEGSSSNRSQFDLVAFRAPGEGRIHKGFMEINGQRALLLDLPIFAEDVITAAELWLAANKGREPIQSNLTRLVGWRLGTVEGWEHDALWLS